MKSGRGVSFKGRTVLIMLLLTLPSLCCLLGFNIYTANTALKNQVAQSNRGKLELFSATLENNLRNTEEFMRAVATLDADFSVLQYAVGTVNAHGSSYNILQKCKYVLASQSMVTGFFIYSQENNLYRQIYNTNLFNREKVNISEELHLLLEEEGLNTSSWFVQAVGGKNYLARIFSQNGGTLACLVSLNNVVKFSSLNQEDILLFFSGDGVLLNDSQIPGEEAGRISQKLRTAPFHIADSLLAVGQDAPYLDTRLLYFAPYHGMMTDMDLVQIFLLVFSGVIFLMVPVCYFLLKRSFFTPINAFVDTMNAIKEGDLEARLESESPIREFQQMKDTFHEMIGRINSLKIIAYEQTVRVQEVRLQYLRMQIRPHFYLNCLKNLYALAEGQRYRQIQEMLLTLSEYLRGMFQDSPTLTPLSMEIHNLKAYIALQSMSMSYPITCRLEMDERLENFCIPPLSLLTFVENSVKHGTQSGRALVINICGKVLEAEEGGYVNLSILDNGPGFPPELMDRLNAPLATEGQEEQQVGIRNIKQQFSLVYGDTATISFSRSGGATVEIFIPLNRKEEKENGCSDC